MEIRNPIGQDPLDFIEESAAKRIGSRIREIRTARGMTQTELGEKVGLTADRVQKYENGYRRPKKELLKVFALALGVETMALADPDISTYLGVMYAFFEMEKLYGLDLSEQNGLFFLSFREDQSRILKKYLKAWFDAITVYKAEMDTAITKADEQAASDRYNNFKWTFPQSLSDQATALMQRQQIQEKIAALEKQLADLEDK